MHGQTGNRCIEITLSVKKSQDLVITIPDNGKGISKEKLAEIHRIIECTDRAENKGIKGIALANIYNRIRYD